jgi:hypothetical protein
LRLHLIHTMRRLIRHELTLLRRLARDRRLASSRMPAIRRTGPTATDGQEAAS